MAKDKVLVEGNRPSGVKRDTTAGTWPCNDTQPGAAMPENAPRADRTRTKPRVNKLAPVKLLIKLLVFITVKGNWARADNPSVYKRRW